MEGAHEKARKAHGPQYGNRGGKPCMYYRQGKCWTGDRCDFIHGEPEHTNQTRGKEFGDNISQETGESTSGQNASSATFGNRPFSPLPTNTDLARCVGKQCVRDNNPSPSIAKAQDKICWKWQAGKCTWGNKCRYSHPPRQTDANAERPAGHQRTHTRVKRTVQAPMSPIVAKAKKPDDQKANISRQQAVRDTIAQQEAARREAESKASGEARQREIIQQETIRKRAMEEALEAAKQHEIQIQQEVIRRREMEKKAMEAARQREIQIQQEAIQRREMEKKATEAARRRSIQMQQEAIRKAKNLAEEALRAEREAAYTAQHIVHGSTTLITCEAGVSIRRVVSGFESCRITVKNLPLNAKPDEIIALFTQQGVVRDDIFIHRIIPNGKHLEATVLTNKTQGSLIAIGLDGVEFKNERLCFETTENFISSDTMGEASGNNADVLTVIWRVPSVTMIATYDDLDVARERARTLDNTICGGRRVRVEMNQPPTGPAFKYYSQSSIKITGLPLDVTTSTVEEFCGTWQVRALKSTAYDLQECLTVLRQHLEGLADSGMRVFDITYPRGQDNQISVRARFETWEHAQRAHDSLDRKRLRSTYPIFRLVIPMPLQFVSTVTSEQYHAQKRIWDSLTSQETNKGCHIRINENHNGKVFIRLVGKEKKAVGAMKVRVETLVAGEKLDSTFWHESFRFPKGKRFLAKVYTDTGVYLRCDWKVRALRMHGDGNEREAARQMVADEIARLSLLEFVIILKRQAVGYLVRTGLAALKEILGEDAVKLDLTSTPCKLTLRGGEEARHALNALLEKSVDMPLARTGEGGDICPICYDDVSHPVKLSCEHVYCTPCLRHYLTSAVDTKIFPLACMGDENKCKWPIPIPVIQRFLIQAQYEHLVDVAFATYLDQHPEEFRYCTTPDCTQIYRCNAENALKCPSCFAEVCSSCHEEAHEGMTCAERKNRQGQEEERLNNDWAALNGVKKCPSCQVWIEKTAGCNHMTCRCGAHICWRCMGVFSREEIYPHLTNVHGGIQDEDVPNVRQNDDQQVARDLQRQFDEERNRRADPIRVRHDFQAPLPVFRQQEEDIQGARFHQAALEALRMRRVVEAREIQAAQQAEQARRQANYQRAQALHQAEQARREAHYQRLVDARQQEAERRQKEGGWGCVVM